MKIDGTRRSHPLNVTVGRETSSIKYNQIWDERLPLFLVIQVDQHIPHEQGMVRSNTDHPASNPVLGIMPGVAIHDVNTLSSIDVINGPLPIYHEGFVAHLDIDLRVHNIRE